MLPTSPSPTGGPGLLQTVSMTTSPGVGSIGGGVLTPGDTFPPTGGSTATLLRDESCLEYTIDTTGLPPGAYTNWMFVFNDPGACINPAFDAVCFGGRDLFNPAANGSAFWTSGGVVGEDGFARFGKRVCVGDFLGAPETQHVAGPGVVDPINAAVYVLVRYHGPASENPDQLYWQTNSLLGGCRSGANAKDFGLPVGIHCPDLQLAIFNPPGG